MSAGANAHGGVGSLRESVRGRSAGGLILLGWLGFFVSYCSISFRRSNVR